MAPSWLKSGSRLRPSWVISTHQRHSRGCPSLALITGRLRQCREIGRSRFVDVFQGLRDESVSGHRQRSTAFCVESSVLGVFTVSIQRYPWRDHTCSGDYLLVCKIRRRRWECARASGGHSRHALCVASWSTLIWEMLSHGGVRMSLR